MQTEKSKVMNILQKYANLQNDGRPIMRTIGSLFLSVLENNNNNNNGQINKEKLQLITDNISFAKLQPKDYFYASLYLSFYEALSGHNDVALIYAKQSVNSLYAKTIMNQDYMVAVAQINLLKLSESSSQ
jgi:hypothetical protein